MRVLRDWFFVLYGDSFLPFDLRRLANAFLAQARPAMMTVYRNEGRFDSSNVRFAHGVVQLYRKACPGETTRPAWITSITASLPSGPNWSLRTSPRDGKSTCQTFTMT